MTLTYTDGEPVQVGDRVTVEGKVARLGRTALWVESPAGVAWLTADEIRSHSPPSIQVGDQATWNASSVVVLAIDGKHAWIRAGDARFTADVSDLRRVTP